MDYLALHFHLQNQNQHLASKYLTQHSYNDIMDIHFIPLLYAFEKPLDTLIDNSWCLDLYKDVCVVHGPYTRPW
jgi:hypothetical protein